MAGKLSLFFDKEADVLYISIGKPKAALTREAGDDILIRLDSKTKKVVGCTILNFSKRFGPGGKTQFIPLLGEFDFPRAA